MTPEALADIHAACFPARPWTAEELKALISEPGSLLESQTDKGFALARMTLDEAELLTIAVCPNAQGRGTGRALLEALVARLAAQNVAHLFWKWQKTTHQHARFIPAQALPKSDGARAIMHAQAKRQLMRWYSRSNCLFESC